MNKEKQDILNQLEEYKLLKPEWYNSNTIKPTINNITSIISIINTIPENYNYPKLMISGPNSQIGLYYDIPANLYIDIELEENNTISIFKKNYITNKQTYIDNIKIDDLTIDWYKDNLPELSKDILII